MELSITAFLRFLAAEHRARQPKFLLLVVQQAVAQSRAHDAGRSFGPQRETVAVVVEREHLLRDDVRELADRTAEKLGALEDRQIDALIAVAREQVVRDRFDS